MLDQWITYGNLALQLDGGPAVGPRTVAPDGMLRDDSAAGADVMIDVLAAAADRDGAN